MQVRLALMRPQYIIHNVIKNKLVLSNPEYRATVFGTFKDQMCMNSSKSLLCQHVVRPRLPSSILFAVGGWTGSHTNIIEAFDPRNDLWMRVAYPEDTPRANHGTVLLEESVYCVGGSDGVEVLSSVRRLALRTHTWHEVSPMHSRRCSVSVTVMDGCIYAMGGYDGHSILKTAERYDPRTNQWTLIAPMLEQRSDASCATLHSRVGEVNQII